MPRRAFLADVELLSSKAASDTHPHIIKVSFDSDNDVVSVTFEYSGLAEPIVLGILCGDVDLYPKSECYFLSLDHAPGGYDQVIERIQEDPNSSCQTLFELVRKVDRAFVRLQKRSRSSISPHEDDAIVIHSSDSEDGDIPGGAKLLDDNIARSASKTTKKRVLSAANVPQYEPDAYVLDYSSSGDDLPTPQRPLATGCRTSRRNGRNAANSGPPVSPRPHQHQNRGRMQADAALGGAFDEPPASEDAEDNFAAYYRSIGKPTPIQVRISEDLRDIRQHGYYFGVLAGMSETSNENMLAVSIRTSDLGLAPEMLMAWDLDPDMFIVLLIRLRSRYMAYETLINAPKSSVDLSFRIRKCAHYKPSAEDARSSFGSKSDPDSTAKSRHADAGSQFAKILISTSLARFMDKYFLSLARYQGDYGCSWADAVNDVVNRTMASTSSNNQDNQRDRTGISPCRGSRQMSFPLLAMQFAMDQLKNCTEYCQACHARLDKSHRSLKPTVCSRDLCLYQHILLGVGRSVEYEILCQPNVVDLLINFCYTALRASNSAATDPIRSYPTNLPLKIPDFRKPLKGIYSSKSSYRPYLVLPTHPPDDSSAPIAQFSPGQWVVIYIGTLALHPNAHELIGLANPAALPPSQGSTTERHHTKDRRTLNTAMFRHAVVSSVSLENSTVYLDHFENGYTAVLDATADIFLYTRDFDDLVETQKAAHLLMVLESLPPVQHLKTELEKPTVNDLKSASGISPAAAVLLNWIMATNRSCILQISKPSLMVHERIKAGKSAPPANYLQFCFLQGVPEADHEFRRQMEINTALNRQHPTLLAWHGSSIVNWHSILRTGLDYAKMVNGRAYGNGVYFSPDFNTSLTYATGLDIQWPKSVFDLRSVVSLYEIINAPAKFLSASPHYVITQRHWSRCRVLFARQADPQETLPMPAQMPALPAPQVHQVSMQLITPAQVPALLAQQAQQAQSIRQIISAQMSALQAQQAQQFPSFQQAVPLQVPALPPQQAHQSLQPIPPSLHRQQNQQVTVVNIGGQAMRASLLPVTRRVQIAATQRPQTSKTSSSQGAVAHGDAKRGRFFVQSPERPATGPLGRQIEVPLVLMPASCSTGDDEEHGGKRARVLVDRGSEVMDASDKAFLSRAATTPKSQDQLPGSTAAAAIAINLDSDGDSGTSQANPGIAAASSRKATTVSLSPRPMRKISPGSKPPNAAADSSRSGQCADPGLTPFEPDKLDYASLPNLPVPSWCTSQAQRALAREIDRMQKVQANTPLPELGWYIDFSRLDNMFQWIVELHSFDMSLPLAKDMISFGVASIVCELRFGADYPFSPPLVRVIRPRFLPFLQGGGGNVTAGGAMCMEALTNTGWTPANQTDAVLLQVRLALCATDRPARLDRNLSKHDYGAEEAFAAYNRAAVTHGWTVPPDMQKRMKF